MMSFHQAPTTFVGQVDLKVSDLERSLQFYQKIIGFSIIQLLNFCPFNNIIKGASPQYVYGFLKNKRLISISMETVGIEFFSYCHNGFQI